MILFGEMVVGIVNQDYKEAIIYHLRKVTKQTA